MGAQVEQGPGQGDHGNRGNQGDLWVQNGRLVTPAGEFAADILIRGGRIAAIGTPEVIRRAAGEGTPVLDAAGCHVLPGVIDAHVHFRDPGLTHKEDFLTGSAAAACGGVTCVLDMPNTLPPVSQGSLLEEKRRLLEGRSYVDFGLYGVIAQGGDLASAISRLSGLLQAGAIAFKLFLGPTTGDIRAPEVGELLPIFRTIAQWGLPIVVHAEDRSVIEVAEAQRRSSGSRDYRDLLASRPRFGELLAVETAARLAQETGARVHIAHLALAEAVDIVRRYRRQGVALTAETCPPYLFLSEDDAARLGPAFKILPPVRSRQDQAALWQGLQDGTIDVVATDHAPHLPEEKEAAGDIWAVPAGSPGVETLVPLMLDAVSEGRLSLSRLVELLCAAPARIFGLYPRKGSLQVGSDGDLTIVDLSATVTVDAQQMKSRAKSSLFHGWQLKGKPVATVVRGAVVAREGQLVGPPKGVFLQPEKAG